MKLEIKDASVVFPTKADGSVHALKSVNLTMKDNEFVVAIGESGCGKTTLLNLIAGFIKPTSGNLFLDDEEIVRPDSDRGVVFQKHALMPWLNVVENATFGLKLNKGKSSLLPWMNVVDNTTLGMKMKKSVSDEERIKIGLEKLALVGLQDFAYKKIYELSGGMQQRVGIARAVCSDPKILLMDEPLGALDQFTRESVQELILQVWKKTQKLVFFITHSIEEAIFMATRLLVLSPRPGRIVEELKMDFCHRYLECKDARKVKSSTDFIEMREKILQLIMKTR